MNLAISILAAALAATFYALARSTANIRAARRDRTNAETEARAIEADRDTLRERLGDAEDGLAHMTAAYMRLDATTDELAARRAAPRKRAAKVAGK